VKKGEGAKPRESLNLKRSSTMGGRDGRNYTWLGVERSERHIQSIVFKIRKVDWHAKRKEDLNKIRSAQEDEKN